jgi:flagellar transcriptional activator FlhD
MKMNISQLQQEIKNVNLSFMQLSQQIIREDRARAVSSLGMSEEMADLVAGLSQSQLLKLSTANMFLCSFRFDDSLLLNLVGGYCKGVAAGKETQVARAAELVAA